VSSYFFQLVNSQALDAPCPLELRFTPVIRQPPESKMTKGIK